MRKWGGRVTGQMENFWYGPYRFKLGDPKHLLPKNVAFHKYTNTKLSELSNDITFGVELRIYKILCIKNTL